MNRFADNPRSGSLLNHSLSRTWDSGEDKATDELLESIQEEFDYDHIVFANRPMGEAYQARQKCVATQMQEHWGDGWSRLWNPPFDLVPLVVRKIEKERDWGLNRSSLVGAGLVRALERAELHEVATSGGRQKVTSVRSQVEPPVVRRPRRNSVKEAFQDGIRATVLSKTWNRTATSGGEEAGRILSDFAWATTTWNNRSSPLPKWLRFCDEDYRTPFPASEGDIPAYVGYLSLEGHIGATSAPKYISAISRYQELHYLASPTRTL